jgi:serine/threonine protein phosphatase PrpC
MTAKQGTADNVASLDSHRPRRVARRAQTLVGDCREMLVEALSEAFPNVMDQIDDALFGLADRGQGSEAHRVYFGLMRQLRVERDGVAARFVDELRATVGDGQQRAGAAETGQAQGSFGAGLSLVENDDLEVSLAIGNMARKVRSVCREDLFGLDRRLALLLGDPNIEDESNPLGPEVVCGAVGVACRIDDASTDVRLLLMKLFEKPLVRELEVVYAQINAHLVRHGVLPDARSADGGSTPSGARPPERRPAEGRSATAREPGETPATTPTAPAVAAARGVLELARALAEQPGGGPPGESAAGPGSVHSQAQVLAGLTALQHGDPNAGGLAGRPIEISMAGAGTRNVVHDLRKAGLAGGLARDDAVVIDVVAMLFDFVLGDAHVCSAIKVQIGRLQIPVLKVAIADHGFFARKAHPVRRYLDTLSEIGLGLDERDPTATRTLAFVGDSVVGILASFDSDPAPFAEALVALRAFLDGEHHGADVNASREARESEDGERLLEARQRIAGLLAERLRGKAVPNAVQHFIEVRWRELLMLRHFADGGEGDGSRNALATVDDLVWSVTPVEDQAGRTRLLEALPFLVARLKAGLRELGVSGDEVDLFMGQLADLHLAAIRATPAPPPGVAASVPARVDPAEGDAATMREAIEGASRAVFESAAADASRMGMGTTVVAALVRGTRLTVGHVGDSRLYRLRDGVLDQLTLDHSMVQELMNKMGCTREEAAELTGSNLLTRAVGTEPRIVADAAHHEVLPDDLYLACSDGLTDLVDDARIGALLGAGGSLESAANALIDAANEAGGKDNVSVILIAIAPLPGGEGGGRMSPGVSPGGEGGQASPGGEDALVVSMHGQSDVGRRRSHNEDRIGIDEVRRIAVLADGMGGHNAGEVASEMAVSHVLRMLGATVERPQGAAGPRGEDTIEDLADAFDVEGVEIEEIELAGCDLQEAAELAARGHEAVQALRVGSWVEFCYEGHVTRARLTRIGARTGRYLFLDRHGLKVANSTGEALAEAFLEGAIRALDDVPLVERTMSSLAGQLRESLEASAAAD